MITRFVAEKSQTSPFVSTTDAVFVGTFVSFASAYPSVASRIFGDNPREIGEYVLYVPAQHTMDSLFNIHQICAATNPTPSCSPIQKIMVIVDQNASAILYYNHDDVPVPFHFIEYRIEKQAHLTVTHEQKSASTEPGHLQIDCHINAHGTLAMICLFSNTQHTTTLSTYAYGEYAHIDVRGAYFIAPSQQATMSVLQHHTAPHTYSNVSIRGLIANNAQLTYEGLIHITKDAVNTNAMQENKNMLFGQKARASSIPRLEILTHEVQCAHGSAIGYLDTDLIWYMQSRGLPPHTARLLLIRGFITELFKEMRTGLSDHHITQFMTYISSNTMQE